MRKLDPLTRALGAIAPNFAMERAVARERLRNFESEPEPGENIARGRPASVFDQGSSETWQKQRDRVEAIWEARAMEDHLCIVTGLLDRISMYCVGQLEYQATTGDDKADSEYEEYFHEKCATIDITGRHRLRTLAEMGLRSMFRDGEHGWVEHLDKGEYKLQAIEADRIGNPQHLEQAEDNIGGIRIDAMGRPVAYQIHSRSRTSQYTLEGEVGPERFIHLFRPVRTDQYHGVSLLKPVIPHAKDLYELFGFEKIAAKFAASFAGFIRESDPNTPGGANTWDSTGSGAGKRLPHMAAQAGTLVRVPRTGGSEIQFAPGTQRPSGAFIALVQAIIREISLGTNLPYGFVYDMSVFGGVTARLETQAAERVFRRFREMLIQTFLDRVKRKVLLLGIAKKDIRATQHWNRGTWQFGASLTGDIGHQVNADATLVQYGVKTRTQWAAELGHDFSDLVDQASAEIQTIQRVSERDGTPMELINSSLSNPTEIIAAAAKAKAGISDEPPPPPGLVGTLGDKGAKGVVDLLTAVGRGELDVAGARNTLVTVYGMTWADSQAVLPEAIGESPLWSKKSAGRSAGLR
jgi:lambda family phage portal protein